MVLVRFGFFTTTGSVRFEFGSIPISSLIGFHPHWLKGSKADSLSVQQTLVVCFSSYVSAFSYFNDNVLLFPAERTFIFRSDRDV